MTAALARAIVAIAVQCLGETRRDWAEAMIAEFDVAQEEGAPLRFACGCLVAGWRTLLTGAEGYLALAAYGLALGVMLPMAALQVGCALFGMPYLFPDAGGFAGAVVLGSASEAAMRSVYQAAVPVLAALQLMLALGHVQIARAVLDRDSVRIMRMGALCAAAWTTVIALLAVLAIDASHALMLGPVLALEFAASIAIVNRFGRLMPIAAKICPGW